jgi:hypothetical protein
MSGEMRGSLSALFHVDATQLGEIHFGNDCMRNDSTSDQGSAASG